MRISTTLGCSAVTDRETATVIQSQERNHPEQDLINLRGGDFYLATSGDKNLAVDSAEVYPQSPYRREASSGLTRRTARARFPAPSRAALPGSPV